MVKITFLRPVAVDLREILAEFVNLWNRIGLQLTDLGSYVGPFLLRAVRESEPDDPEARLGALCINVLYRGESVATITEES